MSENGFSDNHFSNRIFPSTRSYLHRLSKQKGNKKVVFTAGYKEASARCTLLESLFNVYTVCCMFLIMSPTTRRQGLRHVGPLPTLRTYLQPWRSTSHGLRSFRTYTTTQQMHLEGRNVPWKQYCASGL